MKANASKHKAMSYGRMLEEEKRLEAEVERLLEEAEEAAPRGRIPMGLSVADRMRRKLRAKRGRAVYARRKGDCRAGIRPDQTWSGIQAVFTAGNHQGPGGMGPHLHGAQHAQALACRCHGSADAGRCGCLESESGETPGTFGLRLRCACLT